MMVNFQEDMQQTEVKKDWRKDVLKEQWKKEHAYSNEIQKGKWLWWVPG